MCITSLEIEKLVVKKYANLFSWNGIEFRRNFCCSNNCRSIVQHRHILYIFMEFKRQNSEPFAFEECSFVTVIFLCKISGRLPFWIKTTEQKNKSWIIWARNRMFDTTFYSSHVKCEIRSIFIHSLVYVYIWKGRA